VMWNATAGKYVMYYTAHSKTLSAGGGRECVGVATSSAPDGPYVDSNSQPLTCAGPGDNIDPSVFVDGSNQLWLLYADISGIQSQQLTSNGLGFANDTVTQVLTAEGGWENNRIEAPSMIQTADTGILLFYSGNLFDNPGYAVGVARCDSPAGGCTRIPGNPILASSQGPGGQSPFQLKNGSWRMAYHAWNGTVGSSERTLHISNLTFSGTSPNQNPSIG
jgi:beta-xylosidase